MDTLCGTHKEEVAGLDELLLQAQDEIGVPSTKNHELEKQKNPPNLFLNWTKYHDDEYEYDPDDEVRKQRKRINQLKKENAELRLREEDFNKWFEKKLDKREYRFSKGRELDHEKIKQEILEEAGQRERSGEKERNWKQTTKS